MSEGLPKKSVADSLKSLANDFIANNNSPTNHDSEAVREPIAPRNALKGAIAAALAINVVAFPVPAEASIKKRSQFELTLEQQKLDQMMRDITRAPIKALDLRSTTVFSEADKKCLTDNTYHEARGEIQEGRYAVLFATLSRVLSEKKEFPTTVCGVVYQPWQFSWTMDQKIRSAPINPIAYAKIAQEVHAITTDTTYEEAAILASMHAGLPQGAIYYKRAGFVGSPKVQQFFGSLKHVGTVGHHDFFVKVEKK